MKMNKRIFATLVVFFLMLTLTQSVYAETVQPLQQNGFIDIKVGDGQGGDPTVKLMVMVALMSLAPSIFMMVSPFTYIIIVLSMTRQALGTMNIPPNQALIGLAFFISVWMMYPTLNLVYEQAWVPLDKNEMKTTEAIKVAEKPLKKFMLDNTYEKDLALVMKIRADEKPKTYDDVSLYAAVPAYTLTQIQKGLVTGMLIYWAFAFIDIVVSAILQYMGMMMLPPTMISLPFKILMFIYLGGYAKIAEVIFRSVSF